jgi:C4-dicarboxylate-specific signal transduction histidine kinase
MAFLRKKEDNPGKTESPKNSEGGPEDKIFSEGTLSTYKDLILIGKLTPEVVHDINNFLTGILGYAELLSMKSHQDQSIKNGLQNIYISAEKCKDLLAHLTALARPEGPMTSQTELNEVVEKIILLRNCALRHKQIAVDRDLQDQLPSLSIKPNRLEKALLALIFYAEDILDHQEKDRKVIVKTGLYDPFEVFLSVEISVAQEEAYPSLLNAFAAHSEASKRVVGLGMDLQDALHWIEDMGGVLEVEKAAEKGVRFVIRIPIVKP